MEYNCDNTCCASCGVWVWKGTGRWYWFPAAHTLCEKCAEVRAAKRKAAKAKLQFPLE